MFFCPPPLLFFPQTAALPANKDYERAAKAKAAAEEQHRLRQQEMQKQHTKVAQGKHRVEREMEELDNISNQVAENESEIRSHMKR